MENSMICPRGRVHRRKPASLCEEKTSYSMLLKSRTKRRKNAIDTLEPLVSSSRILQNERVIETESRTLTSYQEDVAQLRLSNRTCNTHQSHQERAPSLRSCSQTNQHRWRIYPRHIIFYLCFILMSSLSVNGCHPGIETPGWTSPRGDITVEYGQPLRIFCLLHQNFVNNDTFGHNASDLVFIRNKKRVENEYVRIVNETAIEFFMEKPQPSEDMYYCKLKNKNFTSSEKDGLTAVCLNKVVIGFKPSKPDRFDCVTENWQSLRCEWTPKKNYVTTKYNVSFLLPGYISRTPYFCPYQNNHMLASNKCIWNTSTTPFYRQPYQNYTIMLYAVNVLGKDQWTYHYDNYASLIPAKPVNLSVVDKTSESAYLLWMLPFPLENFPPGLSHRIMYQSQWDPMNSWKIIDGINSKDPKIQYNLTDLMYANTVYDVRVSMKSATAQEEDKWGNYSVVTFRTLSKLPKHPPRTNIGSFEVVENNNNRDIYLYWQMISAKEENGENFHYTVTTIEEKDRRVRAWPNETTKTYAKFKGLSFNNYKFEIASVNNVGQTKKTARIFVPSRSDQPAEPIAFTKIAFDRGLYELSWKVPPKTNKEVKNYTIFWCDNDRDRPYQCTGYFDWIYVPKNITMYNMTVPDERKVYQFAISANTETSSSGMVWASCTVIHNKVIGKMKSAWINRIGSDYIEVGWKLECSDRIGLVEGFKIYYCPIVDPYDQNCQKNTKKNVTIKADPQTIQGVVQGLKPYTTYKLSVSVLTKNGEGLHSDPLFNTTLEAAPSTPPTGVAISNITNSSAVVLWEKPHAMNGVLRYYEVHYNSRSIKVEEATSVELRNLMAHTNYSITVKACTVSCSVESPAVYAVTDIGVPGPLEIPSVRFVNSSQVEVSWKAPEVSAGYLDYYQILNNNREIINNTGTESQLSIPDCQTVGREMIYRFQVRAVNVIKNDTHLYGPWSPPGEGNCYGGGPSKNLQTGIWMICIVAIIAFIAILGLVSKRLWTKCQTMQDVAIRLPPGLAPNMKLLQKGTEQHIRQSSTDSSGCSSGQESVTSSLTSETHISNDSGTEVDPVSTCNQLLEPAPTWETSSLRQRNVGGGKTNSVTDSRWEQYAKLAQSGESPLSDPAQSSSNLPDGAAQSRSSAGYTTMPPSEDGSSPTPEEILNNPYYLMSTRGYPDSNDINFEQVTAVVHSENKNPKSSYVTLAAANAKFTEKSFPSSFMTADAAPSRTLVPNSFSTFSMPPSAAFKPEPLKKPLLPAIFAANPLPSSGVPDIVQNSESTETTTDPMPEGPMYHMLLSLPEEDKSEPVEDTEPLCWPPAASDNSMSSEASSGTEDGAAEEVAAKTNEQPQDYPQKINQMEEHEYRKIVVMAKVP